MSRISTPVSMSILDLIMLDHNCARAMLVPGADTARVLHGLGWAWLGFKAAWLGLACCLQQRTCTCPEACMPYGWLTAAHVVL